VERWLNRVWYEGGAGRWLLWPLSLLFRAIVTERRAAYATGVLASEGVGRPVIVVGNLTVGGTGKTPLVAWLARELAGRGIAVGIVSRGHGGAARAPFVLGAATRWEDAGDEPVLLQSLAGCPVAVGHDRVAAARLLVARGVDVVLADDGLQHLRLARDCEIVVVDGVRGLGNREVLPAGPLRDPPARLGLAHAVVINGPTEASSRLVASIAPRVPAWAMHLEPGPACRLDGGGERPLGSFGRVHAVAAIGNPGRFFAMLRAHGLDVVEHAFADHHPFRPGDLAFGDGLPVLMTAKDAVKCRAFADERLWRVDVRPRLEPDNGRALVEHVLQEIGRDVRAH
jgi:tetraacyldisaccharide 4'-kinase